MKFHTLEVLFIAAIVSGCSYMNMTAKQLRARSRFESAPSQNIKKEIFSEKKLIIYGKIKSREKETNPLAVAAFSYKYGKQETVDCQQLTKPGYYTLSLPLGQYQLFVFEDLNNDSIFDSTECVGYYKGDPFFDVKLNDTCTAILNDVDIHIDRQKTKPLDMPFKEEVAAKAGKYKSEFYPSGSIRSLNDKIFSGKMGALGLYNPSAFLNRINMYFYALKERDFCKIPIVFVHGIGGTPGDWKFIIENLDTSRFDPWLFYYPSGEDLSKTADVFYEIFLSGRIIDMRGRKLIVFAHSMGGIVARAAINKYIRKAEDGFLEMYVSFCTPYGGSTAAAKGLKNAPVVINSWKDVAANSRFIRRLYRTDIPPWLNFNLFFGYRNNSSVKTGHNSDGIITLKSQLDMRAQLQAGRVLGFNETHTSILESEAVVKEINNLLEDYSRLDSGGNDSGCVKQNVIQRYRER